VAQASATEEVASPAASSPAGAAASGTLAAVAPRDGAPPFALLNGQGQVSAYITPARGVDLAPHLGKSIYVYGRKGTIAALNAPYVTALRVAPAP
jgi:hypothetical protein